MVYNTPSKYSPHYVILQICYNIYIQVLCNLRISTIIQPDSTNSLQKCFLNLDSTLCLTLYRKVRLLYLRIVTLYSTDFIKFLRTHILLTPFMEYSLSFFST